MIASVFHSEVGVAIAYDHYVARRVDDPQGTFVDVRLGYLRNLFQGLVEGLACATVCGFALFGGTQTDERKERAECSENE
jgi:hypothetical protein